MDVLYHYYINHKDHIGPAIRYYRKLRGLTQSELGKTVGLSWGRISRHETSRSQSISQTLIERIAMALGVSVEALWAYAKTNKEIPV